MEIFDSHTHLNDEPFRGKEEIYLERAKNLGVTRAAVAGQDPEFNQRAVDLSEKFDNLYAIVGYCPDVAKDWNQEAADQLIEQLKKEKIVALGEIGLDYYWDESPREIQRKVFAEQLEIAHDLKMPVNIHTRDAFEDTYQILKESKVGEYGGILHNFNGNPEWMKKFLDLGLMLSYSGVVSFTKATDVHASAKVVPWDAMLIETDAPYLTPKPYRGKQNETGYVYYVAKAIAELRGVEIEEVAAHTNQNAKKIYGIK
ncbi:TatD family hydrolase [Lactobacillus sp. PV012]|uniref:TatD family hydrolase n=1 Tax=Lactobacillus sp. PV012 TaxID=2594494 RepID=UPI00223FB367|nr:TatD family hydrolase [Lactobacillus sp. PV012]QNQ81773.1 TatD family deoxyribonuclease [Lactobacillus sp. PV012]